MKKRFFCGCLVAFSLCLSACGYRGALYLPQDAEASKSTETQEETPTLQPDAPRDTE